MIDIVAISCPKCGAPLHIEDAINNLTICIYCGSRIIFRSSSTGQTTVNIVTDTNNLMSEQVFLKSLHKRYDNLQRRQQELREIFSERGTSKLYKEKNQKRNVSNSTLAIGCIGAAGLISSAISFIVSIFAIFTDSDQWGLHCGVSICLLVIGLLLALKYQSLAEKENPELEEEYTLFIKGAEKELAKIPDEIARTYDLICKSEVKIQGIEQLMLAKRGE